MHILDALIWLLVCWSVLGPFIFYTKGKEAQRREDADFQRKLRKKEWSR
jgi:hypothetical protein